MKIMNLLIFLLLANTCLGQWPMENDKDFNANVDKATYELGTGPNILLDAGHHNFFVTWGFMEPFSELAQSDGYQLSIDNAVFTNEYLSQYDIVFIITALPHEFTFESPNTSDPAFSEKEMNALHKWVNEGGSLLIVYDHAPFDRAVRTLLNKFNIETAVGYVIDKTRSVAGKDEGWIKYTKGDGFMMDVHPILKGRNKNERINSLVTFGGTAMNSSKYINLLRLSNTIQVIKHNVGGGGFGSGNSQALCGNVRKGKIAVFADANGFTALLFDEGEAEKSVVGMNNIQFDWKQLITNTLYWLSDSKKK